MITYNIHLKQRTIKVKQLEQFIELNKDWLPVGVLVTIEEDTEYDLSTKDKEYIRKMFKDKYTV